MNLKALKSHDQQVPFKMARKVFTYWRTSSAQGTGWQRSIWKTPTVKEDIFVRNLISWHSYNWKMYKINFLPPGLQTVRSSLLEFTYFCQFESTKLNFIRKVLDEKVRNFSPTKISSFTVVFDPSQLPRQEIPEISLARQDIPVQLPTVQTVPWILTKAT